MPPVNIVKAQPDDYKTVAKLVEQLLVELTSSAKTEVQQAALEAVTQSLLSTQKITAFLGVDNEEAVAVITLHDCAAIYAGGVFGEISELYVKPGYRSAKVGELLIKAAIEYAKEQQWQRLEVGTPPPNDSPRTLQFYEREGFKCTGSRMRYLMP